MSCSDKLARCAVLGVQGTLLAHFLHAPIFLDSIIIAHEGSSDDADAAGTEVKSLASSQLGDTSSMDSLSARLQHAASVAVHRAIIERAQPFAPSALRCCGRYSWFSYQQDTHSSSSADSDVSASVDIGALACVTPDSKTIRYHLPHVTVVHARFEHSKTAVSTMPLSASSGNCSAGVSQLFAAE